MRAIEAEPPDYVGFARARHVANPALALAYVRDAAMDIESKAGIYTKERVALGDADVAAQHACSWRPRDEARELRRAAVPELDVIRLMLPGAIAPLALINVGPEKDHVELVVLRNDHVSAPFL